MFGFKKKKQKKLEKQKLKDRVEHKEFVIENQDSLDLTDEVLEVHAEEKQPEDILANEKTDEPIQKKRKTVYHVTKHHSGGWQIKKAGGERAIKRFETQLKAIEYAKILEKEKGIAYVIHKADGKTRKKKY
ncbi:hypothetical protein CI105_03450 [Candidatus Izimaplasma bacterium ZiA1]|uniref:DUF2188 domain-containing protein n=1 Tax=Candidatus Izimoplasma sp. ZiA1 TaxID=2024899 RepID=UPI000BAA496A|nr:hypothetical protein CI105_03450 [Candidatus Izimaplasma bacterium ZiA1]